MKVSLVVVAGHGHLELVVSCGGEQQGLDTSPSCIAKGPIGLVAVEAGGGKFYWKHYWLNVFYFILSVEKVRKVAPAQPK